MIQARDVTSLLLGPGLYLALSLGLLAALLEVRTYLDAIARVRLLILADALTLPFSIAALVVMLFLALAAAATIARERDQGTMEVLFYGPVDHWAYVIAKYLAQVVAFGAGVLALAALLVGYAALSGLRLAGAFPAALLMSLGVASAVAAVGLLCSTLTRGVRSAIGLLLAIVVVLAAVRLGSAVLSDSTAGGGLLFLRDLLIGLDATLAVISPIGVFERGLDAAVRGDMVAYLSSLLLTGLQTVVLLLAAVIALRRRGVRR